MEKKPRGPQTNKRKIISSASSVLLSPMAILIVLFLILAPVVSAAPASSTMVSFTPQDNILIDCGANAQTTHSDGRVFSSDQSSGKYFSSEGRDILVSVPSAPNVPSPIYLSARIFIQEATYTFHINRPGWHWLRLHFFAVNNPEFNLRDAKFSVTTDTLVLLYEFNVENNNTGWFFKEYLVNVTTERLSLKFKPVKSAPAFINAIEVVSAPDLLVSDTASTLFPVAQYNGLSIQSFETVYRLNVGGPELNSKNDTLGRTWTSDEKFQKHKEMSNKVSVSPSIVKYPEGGSPLIAPQSVYASAVEMGNANLADPNFNVTWNLEVDLSYQYLIRMHFCDIVSKSLDDLYFNVYVGGKKAISGLDLSTVTGGLATAYYKDIIVNSSMVSTPLSVQIGPFDQGTGAKNAIINGIEVLKMNNSVNSLGGEYGVDGRTASGVNKGTVAAVGFAMMFGAFVGLGAMAVKWQKRPQDWQKSKSFSSWLLPLHAALPREQVNLAEWAMQWKRKGLLEKIMDPQLAGDINPESMQKFAEAAEKCLAEYGVDRPTMGDVLWNLEYALQLQEASLQGKAEDENKALAAIAAVASTPSPAATVAPSSTDNHPISSPEQARNPAEVQVIDEHSGTAMFAHFATINGR
ncbi:putative receptor-like protein kinase [Camellia lanceoleosa]|uniref:Receptor-like protein kinase n=1 Tax=Camellia lanceoleosa TaxID=1840588 RepID=A0ACC0HJS4_9ERIC|nr:putative receptor-like protein kinase [Camellia lanceoleosa]